MNFNLPQGLNFLSTWHRHLVWPLFLLILAGLSGCVKMSERVPLYRQVAPLPSGAFCRVAVLPFLNDSDYPLGDAIVSKVFATEFQKYGDPLMIQEGNILKVYQQLHLLPGSVPSPEQFRIIADRVDAQFMVSGIIMEMREDSGEHSTVDPMLILEIQLRDGDTGEILWTVFHRRRGSDYKKTMHFGTIHTLTGLSRQMAEEIINLLNEKGLPQCNVSSRP